MVQAASLAVQLYEELRRRIGDGRIAAGLHLSTMALSREFGISQTPVREALARLHADGLAEFSANRGYRVAPAPDALAYGHWMDARIAIEVGAIGLIAPPIPAGLIARLEAANRAIRQPRARLSTHGEARSFEQANLDFHGALVEASGNPFLMRAWRQVAQTAQFNRTHLRSGGVLDRALIAEEHAAVIAALRRGDVMQAAEALQRHIADSLSRDRQRSGQEPGQTKTTKEETHEAQKPDRRDRRGPAAGGPAARRRPDGRHLA